ncbi:MAG TPA: two-component system regulatory protein YycI [Bacillota bacterium]|nr:two-component system regulatory protein YycI [Bacillota bacterium]
MDWTKAKTILIVALIITNLVLIGTYVYQNTRFNTDEKEMQDVTVKLLAEKNIFIETDIPKERPKMSKLTVKYDKMNEDVIKEQLDRQEALTEAEQTDENLISVTKSFIEECGLMTENVTFDRIDRTDDEILVTYKNYIGKTAIEDSYIIFTIKDGKIADFKRYWLNPVDDNDIEKEVIPAVAALVKFMSENTEGEKIHVTDISLVYYLDSNAFDAESPVTDTAFPAWKITYDQGNREKSTYIMAWEQ